MKKLNIIDTLLPVWIGLSMLTGVLLGYYVPNSKKILDSAKFADVSLPIAIGMIWMIYPVMCKVRFNMVWSKDMLKHIYISLVINWVVSPLFMVALGWATLPDLMEYRAGLVLVGTARCIAMVLIWNDLSEGHYEYCAAIVAINSILQIALYGPLAYVYVNYLSRGSTISIQMWPVVRSVLIFLGIPLAAGGITRVVGLKLLGAKKYDKFMKYLGPTSLLALLFVIIVMFAAQGRSIINNIGSVFRVVVPLVIYFGVMFVGVLLICRYMCVPYPIMITQCFTAASNNFELAIAIAGAVYGVDSKEAMAATIGPLVEVPVLVSLIYLVQYVNKRWYSKTIRDCKSGCELKTIVFACVRNAGRSQLSAAIFNDIHNYKRYRALSAGSQPAKEIHQEIVPYLESLGLDVSELHPKILDEDMMHDASVLVTMGCGESCPYIPGLKIVQWEVEDPCGQNKEGVDKVIEDIRGKVKQLEAELADESRFSAEPTSKEK